MSDGSQTVGKEITKRQGLFPKAPFPFNTWLKEVRVYSDAKKAAQKVLNEAKEELKRIKALRKEEEEWISPLEAQIVMAEAMLSNGQAGMELMMQVLTNTNESKSGIDFVANAQRKIAELKSKQEFAFISWNREQEILKGSQDTAESLAALKVSSAMTTFRNAQNNRLRVLGRELWAIAEAPVEAWEAGMVALNKGVASMLKHLAAASAQASEKAEGAVAKKGEKKIVRKERRQLKID